MMAGPNNLGIRPSGGAATATVWSRNCCHADRRRGRHGGQQQRRRGAADDRALARGKEVIVSRGELVEIGGAFRMPDVMAAAGATLVEVGTTNRTHPQRLRTRDRRATALLMKVHTSNYAVQGFTAAVDEAVIARSRTRGRRWPPTWAAARSSTWRPSACPHEPTPQEKLAAGCDVVTFSGDKLLGGPQAGLIVGKDRSHGPHPQVPAEARAAHEQAATGGAGSHAAPVPAARRLAQDLPVLRLLTRPGGRDPRDLAASAVPHRWQAAVAPRFVAEVVAMSGQIGSGSLPVERLPSAGMAVAPAGEEGCRPRARRTGRRRCALPPPVIGRIAEDRLLLDLRCLEDRRPSSPSCRH